MQRNWLMPCNVKYFDIIKHFGEHRSVVWKNISSATTGDVVYIYLGAPHCEIRYKCVVTSDTVDEATLKQHAYAIPQRPLSKLCCIELKYIQMELVQEYPKGTFPLKDLKENGLGQVQVQAQTSSELQTYINKTTSKLIFEK